MNKSLKQKNSRQLAVDASLGSVRAEGLEPSETAVQHAQDFTNSKIDGRELIKRTVADEKKHLAGR